MIICDCAEHTLGCPTLRKANDLKHCPVSDLKLQIQTTSLSLKEKWIFPHLLLLPEESRQKGR